MGFDLVEAINQLWNALGSTTAATVAERLKDANQRRRIVSVARSRLGRRAAVGKKGLTELLQLDWFVDLLADPTEASVVARVRVLDESTLVEFFGDGIDAEAELMAIVVGVWTIAVEDQSVLDALLRSSTRMLNEQLVASLRVLLDVERHTSEALDHLRRLSHSANADDSAALQFAPFSAGDVELDMWRMSSELTGDSVPTYIARDVDSELDVRIVDALAGRGSRLVLLAGELKSGKTRTLLEALSRTAPDAVVVPLRRVAGRDVLASWLEGLRQDGVLAADIVLFVDDLHEHLGDVNLGHAVDVAERHGVLIAATCHSRVLGLDDVARRAIHANWRDVELIERHAAILAPGCSPSEAADFTTANPELAQIAAHFPAGLAAADQLRRRIGSVRSGDQTDVARKALVVAAGQLALSGGQRRFTYHELIERSRCLFKRMGRRMARFLSSQAFEEALEWALTNVGGPYSILYYESAGDVLEIPEVALDAILGDAVDGQYTDCVESPMQRVEIGIAAFGLDDADSAAIWCQAAISTGDEKAVLAARTLLGYVLSRLGRSDEALTELALVVAAEQRVTTSGALLQMGNLYKDLGRDEEAIESYLAAAKWGERFTAPWALLFAGNLLYTKGEVDRAIVALTAASELAEDDEFTGKVNFNLGAALHEHGFLGEAREAYDRSIAAYDGEYAIRAAYNLGQLLFDAAEEHSEIGEHELATKELENAVRPLRKTIATGHPEQAPKACVLLGRVLHKLGRSDEALVPLELVANSSDDDAAEASDLLGIIYAERGDDDAAIAAYRRAIDSQHIDHSASASHNLGLLHLQRGRFADAITCLTDAAASGNPKVRPYAYFAIGQTLERAGWAGDMEAVVARVEDIRPPEDSGRLDATRLSDSVVAADSLESPLIAYGLARFLEQAGRHDEAHRWYETATVASDPEISPFGAAKLGMYRERLRVQRHLAPG